MHAERYEADYEEIIPREPITIMRQNRRSLLSRFDFASLNRIVGPGINTVQTMIAVQGNTSILCNYYESLSWHYEEYDERDDDEPSQSMYDEFDAGGGVSG